MLIGKNVRLQPSPLQDAQRVPDWFSAPAYLGAYYNIWASSRAMMEQAIAAQAHGPEQHAYFIVGRDSTELMGTMGYWNPFAGIFGYRLRGLELWWQVHPKFRQQG